ncbi:WAS/WASL-interacting protein family member 3-like [Myotis myotis]|uniref:WAS/WASL-interacting protein family member 3-like n=1 Tax=Myotis myotis TaxID=51298 RepID=UPI00174A5E67|nr:WAS/WASL-interacting protein family member 3-like [Myotis myotis]
MPASAGARVPHSSAGRSPPLVSPPPRPPGECRAGPGRRRRALAGTARGRPPAARAGGLLGAHPASRRPPPPAYPLRLPGRIPPSSPAECWGRKGRCPELGTPLAISAPGETARSYERSDTSCSEQIATEAAEKSQLPAGQSRSLLIAAQHLPEASILPVLPPDRQAEDASNQQRPPPKGQDPTAPSPAQGLQMPRPTENRATTQSPPRVSGCEPAPLCPQEPLCLQALGAGSLWA